MIPALLSVFLIYVQSPQNPSPMVEHSRSHPRLKQERPAGTRIPLRIGTLFLPEKLPRNPALFVHFHGGDWIPEIAAARNRMAVIHVQLGSGSGVYAKPFADSRAFGELLSEAESKAKLRFDAVGLSSWSAGYGAIREILRNPEHYERVRFLLLLDGLHCGYVGGKPGPLESALETSGLEVFMRYGRDAAAGRKRFLLTHTEIFPGTFASTTETADYLCRELGLKRRAVLRWGPMGTQILSEVKSGGLHMLGFAGNSAPDHVDLLPSLPDLVKAVR